MDKAKIDLLTGLEYPLQQNSYADSVYEALRPPAWYRPLKRRKYHITLRKRVHVVMAEYAKQLLDQIDNA